MAAMQGPQNWEGELRRELARPRIMLHLEFLEPVLQGERAKDGPRDLEAAASRACKSCAVETQDASNGPQTVITPTDRLQQAEDLDEPLEEPAPLKVSRTSRRPCRVFNVGHPASIALSAEA